MTHLGGFLHELGIVLLDVMPGPDGGLQLVPDHHPWSLCARAPDERHDPGAGVRESALNGGRVGQILHAVVMTMRPKR